MESPAATVDVESYRETGFVADVPVFSGSEMAAIRASFDKIEAAETKEVCAMGLLDRHFTDRFIWDMATDERLVDVIEAIAGPDVLLLATHFFCKYPDPNAAGFVAWHQDVTYWGLTPPEAYTAWIAIDDVDVENGCMRVIPGSHRSGIAPHGTSDSDGNLLHHNQEIRADHLDESTAYDVVLPAGHVSVHDGHLIHGSAPNRSARRRCGLTVRFAPAHVGPEPSSAGKWNVIPVRGRCESSPFALHPHPFA